MRRVSGDETIWGRVLFEDIKMPFSSASEIRTYDLTTIEDNALTTEPTPVPDPNPKSNIHITKITFLVRYDYGVENYNCYMFTRLLAGCYINKLIY